MIRQLPTCYIDVDQTLIDVQGNLLPHVREQLPFLAAKYKLICWSAGGAEYASRMLKQNDIRKYFCLVLDKPFIVLDDEPDTIFRRARVVTIHKDSWKDIWDQIFGKKVF